MSVIAHHMDWNGALGEVKLTFDEVDGLFIPYFESYLTIMGQRST